MKKIIIILGGLALAFAFATSVSAATPNWDITGTWTFNDIWLGTPYVHTMTIDSFNPVTGEFSGTGYYNSNTALTWNVNGIESGNDITLFHLLVMAVAPGVTIDGTGTINSSGTFMSGTGYQSNLPGGDPNIEWTAVGTATLTDNDGDGVLNEDDICPNTTADGPWESEKGWGTNRWQVQDNWMWYQNKPAGKGVYNPTALHPIDYTYGCNGHQIIEMLNGVMNGHLKFGLSSSVLDEFHLDLNDGVLDGRYFIETVTVPASKSTDTLSANFLASGINYILKARGTANAGDNIEFDAKYSFRTGSSVTWTDSVSNYEGYGPTLLDLFYNGSTPWGVFNFSHEYEAAVTGTGAIASFRIYDVYYPNNTGNLYVDIYAEL